MYSAGIGVLNAARKTMARMLGNTEVAFESARSQFWVVDAKVSIPSYTLLTQNFPWSFNRAVWHFFVIFFSLFQWHSCYLFLIAGLVPVHNYLREYLPFLLSCYHHPFLRIVEMIVFIKFLFFVSAFNFWKCCLTIGRNDSFHYC